MKLNRLMQFFAIITLAIILSNCKKTTESEVDWGNADFTSFVAIGNSLTAGVADGALYEASQKNSFPMLIAKMAGVDDDFEQPIMGGNGFSYNEENGRLILMYGNPIRLEFSESGTEDNRNLNRAFNNLGIPLIRAQQLYTATTPIEADSNHFVDKILRGSGRTAIQEALSLNPTLITLWIGNNDVLEAATLGLADENSAFTPSIDFNTYLNNIINQLTAGTTAPIFMANIVDITDLPYFTSLPSSVVFGGNQLYLFGECENGIRQLTDEDIVLFWALPDYMNLKTTGNVSAATALNDTLILDVEEKNQIKTIIDEYNAIIKNITDANDQLYLVDMYTVFKDIAENGYSLGGITYHTDLIKFDAAGILDFSPLGTTLFSYDALHPNKYGYASFANSFIDKINITLNANLPMVTDDDFEN